MRQRLISVAAISTFLVVGACSTTPAVSTLVANINASGDVSVGPSGDVFVANFGAQLATAGGENVYRVSPAGQVEVFSNGFGGASGNDFGADGNLYQSDVGRGELYRISPDGQREKIAEGLDSPVGATMGRDGAVFVTQCSNDTVSRITPQGPVAVAQGAPLNCPNGLTIGPEGDLYASNFADGAVVRIQLPSGEMTGFAEIPGGGNGHITFANGRFYVASFRGNRIFELSTTGAVCALAGTGERGAADGPASAATLFQPNGVSASLDGDTLYFNSTVRSAEEGAGLNPNAVRRITHLHSTPACVSSR